MSMFRGKDGISGNVFVKGLPMDNFTHLREPMEGVSNFAGNGGETRDDTDMAKVGEVGR